LNSSPPASSGLLTRIGRSSAAFRGLVENLLVACSPSGFLTEQLGRDVSGFLVFGFSFQIPCSCVHGNEAQISLSDIAHH
jgi:hypothetical protein